MITHTTGIPNNPQGQDVVEHANHTIKELFFWVISPEAKQDPNLGLVEVLFCINFLGFDEAGLSLA